MTRTYDLAAEWSSEVPAKRPSFLLCLHTGPTPLHCSPMPRDPNPATGARLGPGFISFYRAALLRNPAVHDGAVLLGRPSPQETYRVTAWSMRLYPPPVAQLTEFNRGSAFNSCLEMSCVHGVDCMYLVTVGHLIRFEKGQWAAVA